MVGRGVLETALQSIRRGSHAPAALARPQPASPDQGPSGGLRLSPGASGYLPPPDNDFEPLDSDLESPHPSSRRMSGMGPEPPSPISLMPRYEPPSPIDLRPRPEPPSPSTSGPRRGGAAPPIPISLRVQPPSPISLLARAEPPSPGALSPTGSGGRGSPGYRPWSSYMGGVGSPNIISLAAAPQRQPLSPMAAARSPGPLDGAGGSGVFSPTARASGPGTGERLAGLGGELAVGREGGRWTGALWCSCVFQTHRAVPPRLLCWPAGLALCYPALTLCHRAPSCAPQAACRCSRSCSSTVAAGTRAVAPAAGAAAWTCQLAGGAAWTLLASAAAWHENPSSASPRSVT